MKALLVTNGYYLNRNNLYKIERLTEEFNRLGVEVEVKDAVSLLPFSNGDETVIPNIDSYSFALYLDKDKYLAKALSLHLPLYNSYESLLLSDDKMLSILELNRSGIRAPLTIPAPLSFTSSPDPRKVKRFLDQVGDQLGYPLVFKSCHGSLGAQVKLIHDRSELEAVDQEYRMSEHLYEKFMSRHQGHDYRIIVIGGKVIACMERINEKDFRSNIALGGTGYDVTSSLDQSYLDVALKASEVLKLDYAGIDVGTGDDGLPYFIEANGNAFFTEIEKISGINIGRRLAEYLVEKERG